MSLRSFAPWKPRTGARRWIARRLMPSLVPLALVIGACGYDWTVAPAKEGREGGSVKTQTCNSTNDCDKGSYCTFSDGRCGEGKAGTCTEIPRQSECAGETPQSLCACDGQVVKGRCAAAVLGLDLGEPTRCKGIGTGDFACGNVVCPPDTFCLETRKGVGVEYFCQDWLCAERNCTCKETTAKCTGLCEDVDGGTIMHCD